MKAALSERREELEGRAVAIAGGNPRLLDRLYKALGAADVDLDTILTRMEQVEAEFREDVLLDRLIKGRTLEVRGLLATVLLVGIPVHPDELRDILPEANADHLNKATEVGLLEHFRLTDANQWYYASPLLEPYLAGTLDHEAVGSLSGLATRCLYKTRLEGDGLFNDEVGLAIHRLAMAGNENTIAVEMADRLSTRWINNSEFRRARALCELTLLQFEDYRILHNLARAETALGDTTLALEHYEQALALCPPANPDSPNDELSERATLIHNLAGLVLTVGKPAKAMELWNHAFEIYHRIGNLKGKAATLHRLAGVLALQGLIDEAMERWKQALDIFDQVGDVNGKAATLNNMAGVLAQQGEFDQAMKLWNQSLKIKDQIGDVRGQAITLNQMATVLADQGKLDEAMEKLRRSFDICDQIGNVLGKAATLNNMACVADKREDVDDKVRLNRQAAELVVNVGAWPDLVQVLDNMGGVCVPQGLWLGLRVHVPAELLLGIGVSVFREWTPESDAAPLLAAELCRLVVVRYENHPKNNEFQEMTFSLLAACAAARGIAAKDFETWLKAERLDDPAFFMPALDKAIRERIPDDAWLFDPAAVS